MRTPDVVNILSPPGWMAQGVCAQVDPELFYPEKGGSTREATRVCAICPVRAQCLAYALARGERFGVWGGMSERARRGLSRPGHPRQRAVNRDVQHRVAAIRRLSGAGLSDRQVADRVGCSTRTVLRLRARFAIPATQRSGQGVTR